MWEQIRANRIRSMVLVAAMAALLLLIGYFLGVAFLGSAIGGLIMALAIWIVMTLVAFFQGDSIFLALSKARKIERDDHPRLYNVVEEMKIASGLEKMPDIYIIDDPALNAFATGRDPKRASVAITSGLLQKLNRDELQGVIGHEMAHIRNRDVLLMSLCGVLLGTIVILSWYFTRMLFFSAMFGGRRSSSSGGGYAQVIILLVGIVLMILAPILAIPRGAGLSPGEAGRFNRRAEVGQPSPGPNVHHQSLPQERKSSHRPQQHAPTHLRAGTYPALYGWRRLLRRLQCRFQQDSQGWWVGYSSICPRWRRCRGVAGSRAGSCTRRAGTR